MDTSCPHGTSATRSSLTKCWWQTTWCNRTVVLTHTTQNTLRFMESCARGSFYRGCELWRFLNWWLHALLCLSWSNVIGLVPTASDAHYRMVALHGTWTHGQWMNCWVYRWSVWHTVWVVLGARAEPHHAQVIETFARETYHSFHHQLTINYQPSTNHQTINH